MKGNVHPALRVEAGVFLFLPSSLPAGGLFHVSGGSLFGFVLLFCFRFTLSLVMTAAEITNQIRAMLQNADTTTAILIVHVDPETANSLGPSNAAWLGFSDRTRRMLAQCTASKMLNEATFLIPLKSASSTLGALIELTVRHELRYTLVFAESSAFVESQDSR